MAAIHWLSGVSGDWSTVDNWSSGTVPGASDDVTIAAAGTYTVTISDNEAARSLTLDDAGATVVLGVGGNNTLTIGTTLALTAGTFQLNQGASIVGGTLSATGGAFDWAGGELSGVTYDGALNLTSGRAFLFVDGLTLKGANGTGPGTINLSGQYDANLLVFGETLDNATVNMSDGARYSTTAINLFDPGDTNPGLILGKNLDIVQTTGQDFIGQYFNFSNNSLVNDGSITASGGSFTIGVNNVVNNGVIAVGAGETFTINANSLTEGAGSKITVASGSTLHLGVNLNTAQLTQITDSGKLEIGGGYGVTLTNTGATLTVGSGTGDPVVQVDANGEILGGTIVDKGSGLIFNSGGTLSGVTFDGTLNASGATINDGLTLHGVNGTGPGSIYLDNQYGYLSVDGGQTLDNATLDIGSYHGNSVALFDPGGANPTLTLGAQFDVVHNGRAASFFVGRYTQGAVSIVNDGTISAGYAHGNLLIQGVVLTNNGVIAVSNGDTVNLDASSFTEGAKGAISVGAGSTLNLGVAFTTAQLAEIASSGTVGIASTLTNTGSTLKVGTGTSEPAVALDGGGVIVGGTIVDQGSGVHFNGGTLSGVAFDGVMNLAPTYSTVFVENGLTATGVNGQGPGQINLGFLAFFDADGGQTLDNATLDMGYGSNFDLDDPNDTAPVLTLGSHFSIVQTGNGGAISGGNFANDLIVNDGTIDIAFGGNQGFGINPANFTNNGSIIVGGGENVGLQPGTLTNLSGTTLTGGSFEVDGASNIELNQNVAIATLDATVILNGAGSTIESFNTTTSAEVAIDATLGTVGAAGALEILGGRNWTSSLAISNAGTVDLGGGTFTAPSLANTGAVSGFGVIATPLTNTGSLSVTAGQTLSLAGGSLTNLSGTTLTGGTYAVGAGGVLQLADNVSIVTLRATIDLTGAGAAVQSLNTTTSKQVSLASSLTTVGAGGTLKILGGASFTAAKAIGNSGAIQLGGGTFAGAALTDAAGSTLSGFGTVASVFSQAGTVTASGGALAFTGVGDAFAGTLGGTQVDFTGGTDLLQSGSKLTANALGVSGAAVVTLAASLSFAGDLTEGSGTTLALGANTLTLTGAGSGLAGSVTGAGTLALAGGTQAISGGAALGVSHWTLSGADGATVGESLTYSGTLSAGAGTTLTVASGDTLTLTGAASFAGAVAGAGTLALSGGTDALNAGASVLVASLSISGGAAVTVNGAAADTGAFSQAAGTTITLGAGDTLTLSGASTLAGSVAGAGTLAFGGGTQAIGAGASLSVSNLALSGGAVATLGAGLGYAGALIQGAGTTLALGANTLTLTGAGSSLAGSITGTGTLVFAGGTQTLAAGASLKVSKWSLSGSDAATVSAKVSYAGTFSTGAGTTLTVASGDTLTLTGAAALAGTVAGAGTLALSGAAAVTVTGAVGDSGALAQASGTAVTIGSGGTLTLSGSGSTLAGSVTGAGALVFSGGTQALNSGAALTVATWTTSGSDAASLNETLSFAGAFSDGAGTSLTIAKGDTLTLSGAASFAGTVAGAGTLALSGAAAVTVSGAAADSAALAQASGTTVTISSGGALTLSGTGSTVAGTVAGTGTLAVAGGTDSINAGAALSVSNWSLTGGTTTLAENLTYKGAFTEGAGAILTLTAGDKLTLTGADTLAGLIHGASRVIVSTATASGLTIGGTSIFEDTGAVNQTGAVTVGDKTSKGATLTVDAGATWTIAGGGGIGRGSSARSVINDKGTLTNTEAGTSVVAVKVVDTGSMVASTGTLDFTKGLSGTGAMSVNGGATLEADLTVAATLSMTFNGASAVLALKDPSAFAATINGFAPSDAIDLLARKATKAVLGAGDALVITNGANHVATLQLAGDYTGDTFNLASDGAGGTKVTVSTGGRGAVPPPAAAVPIAPAHRFIAAMAELGAGGGALERIGEMHAEAFRPMLSAPRMQMA